MPQPQPQKPVASKLFGIGIAWVPDGKTLRVDIVLANGGAANAKLVVGDRIIGIDGKAVSSLAADAMQTTMLGPEGSSVTLTLLRNGAPVAVPVKRTTPVAKKKLSLDIADMSEVLERKISP